MSILALAKMKTKAIPRNEGGYDVSYSLEYFNEETQKKENFFLNNLLGEKISIKFRGVIFCKNCKKQTKKSFNQGYCYSCFISLAACDRCITSPELCSYYQGRCREPEWGESHCLQPHTVYLSNTSGESKVGITRTVQEKNRWMDQGAIQAIKVAVVKDRFSSGKIEKQLKFFFKDKTNWRKMLSDLNEINFTDSMNLLKYQWGKG